jgi:hypothetical protein
MTGQQWIALAEVSRQVGMCRAYSEAYSFGSALHHNPEARLRVGDEIQCCRGIALDHEQIGKGTGLDHPQLAIIGIAGASNGASHEGHCI